MALQNADQVESKFRESVATPFKHGVGELGNLIGLIAETYIIKSETVALKSLASKIRPLVAKICGEFKNADEAATGLNDELNNLIQSVVNQQRQLRCTLSEKQQNLASRKSSLQSLQAELGDITKQIDDANKYLGAVTEALHAAEENERRRRRRRKRRGLLGGIVGTVLAFTPLSPIGIGILGATAADALVNDTNAARRARQEAEHQVNHHQERLQAKQNEKCDVETRITAAEKEYNSTEISLREVEGKLQELRIQLQKQTEVSNVLKQCMTFISVCFGHAKVLKHGVGHFYCLEQLIVPLKSVADHLAESEIKQSYLLKNEINFQLVGDRLKMVCDAAPEPFAGVSEFC